MDEGLFWGFVAMVLLMAIIPLFMRQQKWAIVSFFGFMLALLIASTIAADGSIVVGYSTNGSTITNITNSDSLPITVMEFLAILSVFVTVGKAVDKI